MVQTLGGRAGLLSAKQAKFLKLNVYDISADSRRFYERLGFAPVITETEMKLDEAGCAALRGER